MTTPLIPPKQIQIMRNVLATIISHYRPNPRVRRAYDREEDQCVYTTASGNHCAVGLHLLKKNQSCHWDQNSCGLAEIAGNIPCKGLDVNEGLDEELIPSARGAPFRYWHDVQEFHDTDCYWDMAEGTAGRNGISERGMRKIVAIKSDWNLERNRNGS
jgi:hypothetical protein